jgi:hypothetical protein
MGKLNKARSLATGARGVITTESMPSLRTFEGGAGFARDAKSELFLLAVANFVGEDTFYEDAAGRDTRYRDLVRQCAAEDPAWTFELLRWLRSEANMRSASIVGAIEAGRVLSKLPPPTQAGALTRAQPPTARALVDAVMLRADEPAEALGYWLSNYGRPLPKWLKRGLGDAACRLYRPYTALKWDSDRNPVRMADVVEFSQIARHRGEAKHALFKWLLDRRHNRANWLSMPMTAARKALEAIPAQQRQAFAQTPEFLTALTEAGMTWEAASGWIGGPLTAALWHQLIDADAMGYLALLRNLNNLDRAGISTEHRARVAARLVDLGRVATSRVLPMQFLNAYNNVVNDYWKPLLDEAATLSLVSVPHLDGDTLILVDTSGSMNAPFTTSQGRRRAGEGESVKLMRWDVAALFGIALGRACERARVVSYSAPSRPGYRALRRLPGGGYTYQYTGHDPGEAGTLAFDLRAGENLLAAVQRFRQDYFIGGGTDTYAALDTHYMGHNRVIVLTDEQTGVHADGVFAKVPVTVPVYTFNLAGYQPAHAASGGNRLTVGGLSDAAFRMISTLESRRAGAWPWSPVTTGQGPIAG